MYIILYKTVEDHAGKYDKFIFVNFLSFMSFGHQREVF